MSVNCGKNVEYTADLCEKTFNELYARSYENASQVEREAMNSLRNVLMKKMNEDCLAGEYKLDCVEKISNIDLLKSCKFSPFTF